MTTEADKPVPNRPRLPPTEMTRFFWDAAKEHRLEILRCACGHYVHWPQVRCPRCQSDELNPSEVSGRGTIYSFCIVNHVFHPVFAEQVPYNVAIVELEEQPGLRVIANITDCANEDLEIGMPVEVTFEDHEDYSLPLFRPAGGARSGA